MYNSKVELSGRRSVDPESAGLAGVSSELGLDDELLVCSELLLI